VLWPVSAFAGARLEVSGSTELSPEFLDVRVDLTNHGDVAATAMTVVGELLDGRDEAHLPVGVPAGETRSALLRYPRLLSRPGTHALLLDIEYSERGREGVLSQRAYLLIALGAEALPAVRLQVPELDLDTAGTLSVAVESADHAPHRVRIELVPARGLRAGEAALTEVPAEGRTQVPIAIYRGAAPRNTVQGILVVARTQDSPVERTAVATTVVKVLPDPARMPKLRRPLLAVAVALLGVAVAWELFALWRRSG
jgi:hypothetical protein